MNGEKVFNFVVLMLALVMIVLGVFVLYERERQERERPPVPFVPIYYVNDGETHALRRQHA